MVGGQPRAGVTWFACATGHVIRRAHSRPGVASHGTRELAQVADRDLVWAIMHLHLPERGGVMMAGLRGFVGGLFAVLGWASMMLWIATTPQLRSMGRVMVVDPQLVMLLAIGIVAPVALLMAWSHFGRGMVAAVGLVLAGNGVLVTVMALGGLSITGRPGPPTSVSVWPIMGAMLGLAAMVVTLWRSPDEILIGRRQIVGSWVATLLAVAAVGVPSLPVSVAGAAPSPVMTPAGSYVAQATAGLLVVLVATAGLRARRGAALGQAVAAVALMGASSWVPALVPGTAWGTRPPLPTVVLVLLAVTTWAVTAGRPDWDQDWDQDQDWEDGQEFGHGEPDEAPPRFMQRQGDSTAVLDSVEATSPSSAGGSRRRAGNDTTIVMTDNDRTEVIDASHAGDPTIRIDE